MVLQTLLRHKGREESQETGGRISELCIHIELQGKPEAGCCHEKITHLSCHFGQKGNMF